MHGLQRYVVLEGPLFVCLAEFALSGGYSSPPAPSNIALTSSWRCVFNLTGCDCLLKIAGSKTFRSRKWAKKPHFRLSSSHHHHCPALLTQRVNDNGRGGNDHDRNSDHVNGDRNDHGRNGDDNHSISSSCEEVATTQPRWRL
ncbi:hypothetical protein EDB85DRAFT_1982583 [Lactarius pseudohatsudake]|nr:hypothetical protein EDB85DRAFT_1989128 [Lactarius pseudohatsudake]KAH9025536.1 hypothetical protein EDB85DRAFT_1982583 [Lactarius pseudohatsudake]